MRTNCHIPSGIYRPTHSRQRIFHHSKYNCYEEHQKQRPALENYKRVFHLRHSIDQNPCLCRAFCRDLCRLQVQDNVQLYVLNPICSSKCADK